jgi:S-DNA-T family DNA segregation ATPase FtsK/SpoIIIE
VTEYEFTPDRFTRISRLKTLNEDLALSLSVDTVSIRRIPGRPCIGISIPNKERQEVTFQSCMPNIVEHSDDMEVPLNFGILSDGSPYVEDIAKYPHLLIGGATGTGKSVLLNQIITSLVAVRSPKQLQLVLIDPKTVELFPYKTLPHLMREPVARVWQVIDVLSDVIRVMKQRTEALHDAKVNNIKEYNAIFKAKAADFMKDGKEQWAVEQMNRCWPYILVVIDEMAEIVLEEKRMFINQMASISQMARATGISVIAATQRPSIDVLPGKIKVNFLARACFRCPSPQDSKTVLNFKGAETLLGKGDLFVLSPDKTGLQRIHVAMCKNADRDPIVQRAAELGYDTAGRLLDYPKSSKKEDKVA